MFKSRREQLTFHGDEAWQCEPLPCLDRLPWHVAVGGDGWAFAIYFLPTTHFVCL